MDGERRRELQKCLARRASDIIQLILNLGHATLDEGDLQALFVDKLAPLDIEAAVDSTAPLFFQPSPPSPLPPHSIVWPVPCSNSNCRRGAQCAKRRAAWFSGVEDQYVNIYSLGGKIEFRVVLVGGRKHTAILALDSTVREPRTRAIELVGVLMGLQDRLEKGNFVDYPVVPVSTLPRPSGNAE